ncbi:peroxisomal multifunctional enzyme type 2 [Elysia marginata]|uniref:Peroxisomal multifunctional enzyme type 2 n=1 Tax=Elysia marginata TaxID=1093978 RepID=A0AAV4IXX7_9GAST|nr:peroxisomal multifunctional enzyme type 2 [Elysia marginata]
MNMKTHDVYEGDSGSPKADCTLTLPDETFMDLVSGKLSIKQAFMEGSLKISGNIPLAQKLGDVFPDSKI